MKSIVTPRNLNIYQAFSILLSSLLAGIKGIMAGPGITSRQFFWPFPIPSKIRTVSVLIFSAGLMIISAGQLTAQLQINSQPASASICQSSSTTLSITFGKGTGCNNLNTGNVDTSWEYSSNGSSGWATVGTGTPTGFTYTIGESNAGATVVGTLLVAVSSGATGTGYYRCVASQPGGCATLVYSNVVSVAVNPLPTLTGASQPVAACSGTGASISLTGLIANSTSSISYTIAGTPQSNITGVSADGSGAASFTSATLTTANNGQTLQITGVTITSATPNCTKAFTQNVTLTVNALPTAGTVAANQTICNGGDPTAFTESVAATGVSLTYQWQSSSVSNFSSGVTTIGGATSNTYDAPSGITSTTYYRRATTSTQNGIGCIANSNILTVTVQNTVTGGTIASAQTICTGSTPASFTQTVASTGSGTLSYQWQSSTVSDFSSGVTTIGGATSTTYSPGSLATTTYYRRQTTSTLNSVACGPVNSNVVTVTVTTVPSTSGLTANVASNTCSGNGVVVTITSGSLNQGTTYTVSYTLNPNQGGNTSSQADMIYGAGSGNFTTAAPSSANATSASVTITQISIGSCSTATLSIPAGSTTINPLPSSSISISASAADVGNPNGSTISLRSKKLTAGTTYTVAYTLVGINGNTYPSTPGTTSVTMANQASGTTKLGTFITNQLSTPGQYRITINSIAFASTGCAIATTATTTFTIQAGFVTQGSGTWNTPSVWGGAGTGPNYNDGTITIRQGDIVTMPDTIALSSTWTLDQFVVYGTLIIESGMKLIIVDGALTDITMGLQTGTYGSVSVFGTLEFSGDVTHAGTDSSPIIFNASSVYRHAATTTEGSPPFGTWNATSTFSVVGYTTASGIFSSSGWTQNFGDFIWNCPLQIGDINLDSKLGPSIQDDLTISDTGITGILRLVDDVNYTLTIGGDMVGSGSASFSSGPSAGGNNLDIFLNMVNFTYGSTAESWLGEAGLVTINISGNMNINSGKINISDGGNGKNSGGIVNLAGDLTIASLAIMDASSSQNDRLGVLNYNNLPFSNAAKTHLHTVIGTIDGNMKYLIEDLQTVRTVGESPFYSERTNVDAFTMASTSKLIVESTSPDGAIQLNTTGGNLRVTGRTLNAGATIEYGLSPGVTKQYIGSGHPPTAGVHCIINNAQGVDVNGTAAVEIGGNLTLQSGVLTLNTTVLAQTASRTLTVQGSLIEGSGSLAVISDSNGANDAINATTNFNGDFNGTSFLSFSGNNCNVTIGNGAAGTFTNPFPLAAPISPATTVTVESFTMNKPGATLNIPQALIVGIAAFSSPANGLFITSGNLKMNAALTVVRTTTVTTGSLDFKGQTAILQEAINTNAAGYLNSDGTSSLTINGSFNGGTTNLHFAPPVSGVNTAIGTITLDRSTDQAFTLQTDLDLWTLLDMKQPATFNSQGAGIPVLPATTTGLLTITSRGTGNDPSTADDGRIGPILNGGIINGNVSVQRYKDANLYEDYKYIGSPAANVPFPAEMWRLHKWNPVTGLWSKTYENMTWGVGYAAQTYAANVVLTFTGAVKTGDFSWTLPAGWNLIANPYPSAIRWADLTNSAKWILSTGVSNVIGITDNDYAGYPNYFRHLNGPVSWGSDIIIGNVIATGQAFWVYADTGGGTLTVKESAKVLEADATGNFYRQRTGPEAEQLTLAINNGKMQDQAFLTIGEENDKNNRLDYHLPKLWNPVMNIYLLEASQREMLTHTLKDIPEGMRIPVGIKVTEPQEYKISFTISETFGYTLYLIDQYEGISVPVTPDMTYSFKVEKVGGQINDRFYLSRNPEIPSDMIVSVYPNPATDQVSIEVRGQHGLIQGTLLDVNGSVVNTIEFKRKATIETSALRAGIYILKLKTENGILIKKLVKQQN